MLQTYARTAKFPGDLVNKRDFHIREKSRRSSPKRSQSASNRVSFFSFAGRASPEGTLAGRAAPNSFRVEQEQEPWYIKHRKPERTSDWAAEYGREPCLHLPYNHDFPFERLEQPQGKSPFRTSNDYDVDVMNSMRRSRSLPKEEIMHLKERAFRTFAPPRSISPQERRQFASQYSSRGSYRSTAVDVPTLQVIVPVTPNGRASPKDAYLAPDLNISPLDDGLQNRRRVFHIDSSRKSEPRQRPDSWTQNEGDHVRLASQGRSSSPSVRQGRSPSGGFHIDLSIPRQFHIGSHPRVAIPPETGPRHPEKHILQEHVPINSQEPAVSASKTESKLADVSFSLPDVTTLKKLGVSQRPEKPSKPSIPLQNGKTERVLEHQFEQDVEQYIVDDERRGGIDEWFDRVPNKVKVDLAPAVPLYQHVDSPGMRGGAADESCDSLQQDRPEESKASGSEASQGGQPRASRDAPSMYTDDPLLQEVPRVLACYPRGRGAKSPIPATEEEAVQNIGTRKSQADDTEPNRGLEARRLFDKTGFDRTEQLSDLELQSLIQKCEEKLNGVRSRLKETPVS